MSRRHFLPFFSCPLQLSYVCLSGDCSCWWMNKILGNRGWFGTRGISKVPNRLGQPWPCVSVTVLQSGAEQSLLTLLRVFRFHHSARNDLVDALKGLSFHCFVLWTFSCIAGDCSTEGLRACAAGGVSSLEYQDRQEPLLDGKEVVSPTKTRNGNFALAWNVPLDSHDLTLSALESGLLCLQGTLYRMATWWAAVECHKRSHTVIILG